MGAAGRHLVTTADERTWPADTPLLFLGEWCRSYQRRSVWSGLDAALAEPYGLSIEQRKADDTRLRALESRLLPQLAAPLNRRHGMERSTRFWQIVLGHWLRTALSVLFNRYRTIEECLAVHDISGSTLLRDPRYRLATPDSLSMILASRDTAWNHALAGLVMRRLAPGISLTTYDVDMGPGFRMVSTGARPSLKRRMAAVVHSLLSSSLRPFGRETDAFILNSYLPRPTEVRLQLALRQAPQFWRSVPVNCSSKPEDGFRDELGKELALNASDPLEAFMRETLPLLLPTCYLEGFGDVSRQVASLPWPRRPKLIFTSNSFDTDEPFKLWAASRAEEGSRYCVGQHGGNYGVFCVPYRTVEEETADRFVTWGWEDGLSQHRAGLLLNVAGRTPARGGEDPRGDLLLVEECINHRVSTWDDTSEFVQRWAEQLQFIGALKDDARRHLLVRLHPYGKRLDWFEGERLRDFDPSLRTDSGQSSMRQLMARSRLVVFSYNSSGFYEAMALGVPALVCWPSGLDWARDTTRPCFERLLAAGILHLSAASAAQHVNAVFDDVRKWWDAKERQKARLEFCARFARTTTRPVEEMKAALLG